MTEPIVGMAVCPELHEQDLRAIRADPDKREIERPEERAVGGPAGERQVQRESGAVADPGLIAAYGTREDDGAAEVHATVRRRLCAIDESLSAAVEFAEEAEVRGGVHRRELVVPGGRRPKDAETLTEEAAVGEGRDRERVAGP